MSIFNRKEKSNGQKINHLELCMLSLPPKAFSVYLSITF